MFSSKGRVKKNSGFFLLVGKNKKMTNKNDISATKRILYDMALLTLVRWLLQRAFKSEPPFGPGSVLKRVPPTQKLKSVS